MVKTCNLQSFTYDWITWFSASTQKFALSPILQNFLFMRGTILTLHDYSWVIHCSPLEVEISFLHTLSGRNAFLFNFQMHNKEFKPASVACAGFILAGQKTFLGGGQKINQGGAESPPLFLFLPPWQNSILPLGQNRQDGGQKTFVYQKH